MSTTDPNRRPRAPRSDEPGVCAYCHHPTGDRTRAHERCRREWQETNRPDVSRPLVLERDGRRCVDCGGVFPLDELQSDHVEPLAENRHRPFANHPTEMVARCRRCHAEKTARENAARNAGAPVTSAPSAVGGSGLPVKPARVPYLVAPAMFAVAPVPFLGVVLGWWLWGAVWAVAVVVLGYARWRFALWRWGRRYPPRAMWQRLAYVMRDRPDTFGKLKVNRRDGSTPVDVTIEPPSTFSTYDQQSLDDLRRAFAGAIGASVDDVRGEPVAGTHYVRLSRVDTTAAPAGQGPALPGAQGPVSAPVDAELTEARDLAEERVEAVLGRVLPGVEVEVTDWRRSTPRALTATYPAAEALTVRNGRGDILDALEAVYEPGQGREYVLTPARNADRLTIESRPNPLARPIPLPPIRDDVDPAIGVVIGALHDSGDWVLPILYRHTLIVGASGSGKGSILWGVVRGLSRLIADGRVRLWVIDPKGGMEFGALRPIAHRFSDGDGIRELLADYVAAMEQRSGRYADAGVRKFAGVTHEEPLEVLIVDEIASLTAYATSATERNEVSALLSRALSKGRAVGFSVIGAIQDPRAKVLDIRALFTQAVCLRVTERTHVDMALGAGMRASGALADRLPREGMAGTAYAIAEGQATPVLARAAFVPDDEVERVAAAIAGTAPETREAARSAPVPVAPVSQDPEPVSEAPSAAPAASGWKPRRRAGVPFPVEQAGEGEVVRFNGDSDPVTIVRVVESFDGFDQVEVTYTRAGRTTSEMVDRNEPVTPA